MTRHSFKLITTIRKPVSSTTLPPSQDHEVGQQIVYVSVMQEAGTQTVKILTPVSVCTPQTETSIDGTEADAVLLLLTVVSHTVCSLLLPISTYVSSPLIN